MDGLEGYERARALGRGAILVTAHIGSFETGLAGLPFTLRRRGLFMGLKFPNAGDGITAAGRLIDAGVFAVFANNDTSVLQFLPPLIVTDEEVDEIVAIVGTALG